MFQASLRLAVLIMHVVLKGIVDWQFSQLISKSKKRTVWCWSKVDNAALKRGVASEDWTDVLSTSDMDVAWGRWKDKLLSIAPACTPAYSVPTPIQALGD